MFQDVLNSELADLDPRSYPNSGAGSPWDGLLDSPLLAVRSANTPSSAGVSSGASLSADGIKQEVLQLPKLVPEVEEGNIEYKFKLLDPSPARFARLVTQLKWRLLEGQGQAYYEIGVADSGLLIGLTKHDLEKSLETLEEMAGEIGASVIIVKEVEVPDVLVRRAEHAIRSGEVRESCDLSPQALDDEDELWRPRLGAWDRRSKRAEVLKSAHSFSSSATTTTLDTETETDEVQTDDDAVTATAPVKTFQALDFDDLLALGDADADNDDLDLGLFPFDPELSPETFITTNLECMKKPSDTSLSIASVFKLRPLRRRAPSTHVRPDKRQQKMDARISYNSRASKARTDLLDAATAAETHMSKNERRRMTRDRRREFKRQALLAGVAVATASLTDTPSPLVVVGLAEEVTLAVDNGDAALEVDRTELDLNEDLPTAMYAVEEVLNTTSTLSEPRLIIEVLVVRKLSIGAATYGDFGFRFDFE